MSYHIFLGKIILICMISMMNMQNVIISMNHDDLVQRVRFDYKNLLKEFLPLELPQVIFNPIKQTEDSSLIEITDIKFVRFELSNTEPFVSLYSNAIAYTPNIMTLIFSMKYQRESLEIQNAELYFNIYNLVIQEEEDMKDHKPRLKITIEDKLSDYEVKSSDSSPVPPKVKIVIQKYFALTNMEILINNLNKISSEGYLTRVKRRLEIRGRYSQNIGKNIFIKMESFVGFCTDYSAKKIMGQCYYPANINWPVDYSLKRIPELNPDFFVDDGYFHIFINHRFLKDLLSAVEGTFYRLNTKTKPTKFNKIFNVANLIRFFPLMSTSFLPSINLEVVTEIKKIALLNTSQVKIISDSTFDLLGVSIFYLSKIKSEMVFNYKMVTVGSKLNFCLTKLDNLLVTESPNDIKDIFKLEDIASLTNIIKEIITLYLEETPFYLIDPNGIDLNDFIKFIDFGEFREEGIYLKGKIMFE